MPDEPRKDSRDRTKPDAPEGSAPTNEQRRFRGDGAGKTAADQRRKAPGDETTAADAPMDPEDEEFIDNR